MADPKVIIVTGANRGIGSAISKLLLSSDTAVHVYACSRRGQDLNFPVTHSSSRVTYPRLDISDSSSITSLSQQINGKIDVLINNAGANEYSGDSRDAARLMKTNYYGTKEMCLTFLPLMRRSGGRIVNVSSTGSLLNGYDSSVTSIFRSEKLTLEKLDSLAQQYLTDCQSNDVKKYGSDGGKGYCFSKACVNALTAVLARENEDLVINCCCPGWVATDMGRIVGQPSKTPEQGAKIPLRLGVGDVEGVSGRYWANDSVNGTGDGRVMAW